MVKRTVLKVDIPCNKCKQKLFKSVSTLEGVDRIEIDAAKGTVTVTGDADPIQVIIRTRKAARHAEVISIGPPPPKPAGAGQKKEAEKEKKPQPEGNVKEEKPLPLVHLPSTCLLPPCQHYEFQESYLPCTIM